MEPCCTGCGTPLSKLDSWWDLYDENEIPGPVICRDCWQRAVSLLRQTELPSTPTSM